MTQPKSVPEEHLYTLDGLRALAILSVLGHNLSVFGGELSGASRWVELAFDFGWAGVQLFFVLSGFLITRVLFALNQREDYLLYFYKRRVRRIVPLYALALAILLFVVPALGLSTPNLDEDRKHQVWLWLYLTNWHPHFAHTNSVVNHFWSLAVEEQFYLLWPLLVRRAGAGRLLQVCAAIALASLAWRIAQVRQGTDPALIYVATFARFDALALGAAVAVVFTRAHLWSYALRLRRWMWPAVGIFGVLGIFATQGVYPQNSPLGQTVGYTWLSLLFALVILAALTTEHAASGGSRTWMHRFLSWKPLTWIGSVSYSVYVIHKPIHDLAVKPWWLSLGVKPTQSVAVATLALILEGALYLALAAILYRFVERPFLTLR